LELDLSDAGLGVRSKRYAMIVKDGKVVSVNVEQTPKDFENSSAEAILRELEKLK
jgi:peroxiredoxin